MEWNLGTILKAGKLTFDQSKTPVPNTTGMMAPLIPNYNFWIPEQPDKVTVPDVAIVNCPGPSAFVKFKLGTPDPN